MTAAAYDAKAEEYVELLGSVAQMPPEDVATITAWGEGVTGPVLDAGCGPGHWSDHLAKGADRHVVGVDASAAFVRSARARFPGTDVVLGDLRSLPLADGAVAGVLAWYSIIHAPPAQLPGICAEVARVLRPGGSLLLGYFDGEAGAPFEHAVTPARCWGGESLAQVLAPHGLVVDEVRTRPAVDGRRAHGHLVARRVP